eukprot:211529_1
MPRVELSPTKSKKRPLYFSLSSDEDEYDIPTKIVTDELSSNNIEQPTKIYREVILITISLFMGYASLVCLQKKLYNKWESNLGTTLNHEQKQLFEHGASLIYFGNLIFRLLHNVIFCIWTPRQRVVISLLSMCFAQCILLLSYWVFKSTFVGWVYISYLIGGIGVGSFESNFLATITPLGHDTKLWGMIGMSVGFVLITVGGYAFMALTDLDVVYIYATVFICCFLSIFLFLLRIPGPKSYNHQQTFKEFVKHIVCWRQWLPNIKWYCVSLMVDMFCLSYNTAISQYIYDGDTMPLFGLLCDDKWMIKQNVFFCVLNLCQFIGDLSGRKIIYYYKLSVTPYYFLIFSIVGMIGCMSKIPIFALFATICITFANGAIYSSTTRFMDNNLTNENRKYLLTSLSVWLFVGDIGSVTGSNVWEFIKPVVCNLTAKSQYFCVPK